MPVVALTEIFGDDSVLQFGGVLTNHGRQFQWTSLQIFPCLDLST